VILILRFTSGGSFIDDLASWFCTQSSTRRHQTGYDRYGLASSHLCDDRCGDSSCGCNVFVVKNLTKVPFGVIYGGVYPFLIGLIFCAALLFIFPQLMLFLPSLFGVY
jgi:hypothetical protein